MNSETPLHWTPSIPKYPLFRKWPVVPKLFISI